MTRTKNAWRAAFKKDYPDCDVVPAIHKFDRKLYGWHNYPPEQIQAVIDLCKLLVAQYGAKEIVGHDDIRPKAKWDPGPAFPLEYVCVQVFGPKGNGI